MFDRLKNGEKIAPIVKEVESQITEVHKRADEVIESNQFRVLESFRKHKISDSHFIPTTGYGYDDIGRDTLESVCGCIWSGSWSCSSANYFRYSRNFNSAIRYFTSRR